VPLKFGKLHNTITKSSTFPRPVAEIDKHPPPRRRSLDADNRDILLSVTKRCSISNGWF